MPVNWSGIFPALTTKFTADDKIDLQLFEKNLHIQQDAGVNGVIVCGSLGEGGVLAQNEKQTLVKFTKEKLGGKLPLIVNIAENSTAEAISQAQLAESWGADGLMLLPPMRYKADAAEIINWFSKIAASTELPIMIYNNPVDYKNEVTIEMFSELSGIPSIQAVKESTRDVANVTRMRKKFGDRYKILCGVDTLAMEELCSGADGWVAGLVCAFPHETVALYNYVKAGQLKQARDLNQWFMPLLELDIHPKLVQYIKLAETETRMGSEFVRSPRLKLVGEEREQILKLIREALKQRPVLK
jgi:1-pyrroline-4-hydroxy-2-carboxylate deaminase